MRKNPDIPNWVDTIATFGGLLYALSVLLLVVIIFCVIGSQALADRRRKRENEQNFKLTWVAHDPEKDVRLAHEHFHNVEEIRNDFQ